MRTRIAGKGDDPETALATSWRARRYCSPASQRLLERGGGRDRPRKQPRHISWRPRARGTNSWKWRAKKSKTTVADWLLRRGPTARDWERVWGGRGSALR